MGSQRGRSHLRYAIYALYVSLLLRCVFFKRAAAEPSTVSFSQLDILKAKQHIRKLREATLHTIQSSDGDTIDCILREKQPAFDHPLLKNHTLQESPSSLPKGWQEELQKSELAGKKTNSLYGSQMWHRNGRCPEGTIPVRRPSLHNILQAPHARSHRRAKPFYDHPHHYNTSSLSLGGLRHEFAIGSFESSRLLGTSATLNVWNPTVTVPSDVSISQMWVVAGKYQGTSLDTVEAGWSVEPFQYGDAKTRFFVYWTNDFYNINGCLNLLCPGFVQVSNELALGGSLDLISIYGGEQQELQSLTISKDQVTGDWWLTKEGVHIGYWPNKLFVNGLSNAAERVQWGGEVVNSQPGGQHTDTQMGSGHYPREGEKKACYARSILQVDPNFNMAPFPASPGSLNFFSTNPSCYYLDNSNMQADWGTSFFYGGPGRSRDCI